MFYCEGKYCSRRDSCAYHEQFEWKYPRQHVDKSIEGIDFNIMDENGNHHDKCDFTCGDKAIYYKAYMALGYRKGEEYKNSLGFRYDEICVNCEHKSLCFLILEHAGLITHKCKRIVNHICEDVMLHSDTYKKKIETNK